MSVSVNGAGPSVSYPLACASPSIFASIREYGGGGGGGGGGVARRGCNNIPWRWSLVCVGSIPAEKVEKAAVQVELLLFTSSASASASAASLLSHRITLKISAPGAVKGVALSRRRRSSSSSGGGAATTTSLVDVFVAVGVAVGVAVPVRGGGGSGGSAAGEERPAVRSATTVEEYDVAIFRRTVCVACEGESAEIRETDDDEEEEEKEGKKEGRGEVKERVGGTIEKAAAEDKAEATTEEAGVIQRALLRMEERVINRIEGLEKLNKQMANEISACHEKIKQQGDLIKLLLPKNDGADAAGAGLGAHPAPGAGAL